MVRLGEQKKNRTETDETQHPKKPAQKAENKLLIDVYRTHHVVAWHE